MNICTYYNYCDVAGVFNSHGGRRGGMYVLHVEYKADSEDDLWAKMSKTANLDMHNFLLKLFLHDHTHNNSY